MFGQNSVMPNCFFVSQSIDNPNLYNIPKNQPPGSVKRDEMGGGILLTLKKACSCPIYLSNQAMKLKFGMLTS